MMRGIRYSEELVADFPGLHSMVVFVDGISHQVSVSQIVGENLEVARDNLRVHGAESKIESVQQWRAAYRSTDVDPTKFRMAAESILRRLRTRNLFAIELHPLVVLCNSFSARFAMPVAALDVESIEGLLRVCYASGKSIYDGFDGAKLVLPVGEVTFEDEGGRAHARKWSHRQSAFSAVSINTSSVVIIAEGLHANCASDLLTLLDALTAAIRVHWPDATITGRVLAGEALSVGLSQKREQNFG